jgi:hypothetical protein
LKELSILFKPTLKKETNTTVAVCYLFSKIKVLILIAVTLSNEPYYNEEGDLVFRPGGHGALIENLNSSKSDIIFIKNIDNVIQNNNEIIAVYKKSIRRILIDTQQQVFFLFREN